MPATDQSTYHSLKDIAGVQAGYPCRTAVTSIPTGTHLLLQARDISRPSSLRLSTAVRFQPQRNTELYQVKRSDILLLARGQDHRVCLVDADLPNVLASNVFYIIRPDESIALPGYLAWWLNQSDTQALLDAGSVRTGIGFIARSLVEQLAVPVPALETQRRIVSTMDLWRQHQSLQTSLNQKREQVIQSVCRQAVGLEKESSI